MYDETTEEMNVLRFQSAQGYQEMPLDTVKGVNFSPIGSVPEQFQGISEGPAEAISLLQLIDFGHPFDTEDKPAAVLVGQLTVTFETEGQGERTRTFNVLGYSMLQDTSFPTTYYWASPNLRSSLQGRPESAY